MPRDTGTRGQGDTGTWGHGTRGHGEGTRDKGTRDKGTRGQGDKGTREGSRWRFKPHLITSHQARRLVGLETLGVAANGEVSPELPLSPCPLLVSNGISHLPF